MRELINTGIKSAGNHGVDDIMAVRKSGILRSLSNESLNNLEQNLIKYQNIATKKKTIDRTSSKKGSGIYSQNNNIALPSAFVRKQRRRKESGLADGRLEDSAHAKGTLSNGKIRPEEEPKINAIHGLMESLGIKKYSRKASKGSLVSTGGRPIKSFDNEFTKLCNRTNKIENNQKALSKLFSQGQNLVLGAGGLTSISGITSLGLGFASKIPYIAVIIGIATTAAKVYVAQYNNGGTRDTRVKRLDESSALTSVSDETEIFGGERLQLSIPNVNHGLPSGNSNTQNMRAGTRTHKLRRDGVYH